ncbi:protein ypfJ [Salmonella enterica subsp. salamae]|nr:protein ypfJ [Salmonella enterica subsp. salamae]
MRWQGRRESNNVEDRRNRPGGPSLGGPGFRLPRGKGGIILLVVVLVAGYYGVDLTGLLTGQPVSQQQSTRSISPNDDEAAKFTSVILATTEDTWGQLFQKMGRGYQQPKLVMYRGMTRTGCGAGQSVMGPFYCPADGTVYIDLSFYDDMKNKLGADGDFAQGYVIAHEVGHHVQKLLGIEPKVRQLQQNASQTEGESPFGAHGATGGLLCRRVGTQYAAARRTGGRRSGRGAQCRTGYRRRSLTATGAGARGAG